MICFLLLMHLKADIFVNKELENFLKEKKETDKTGEVASILEKAKVQEEKGAIGPTVSESAVNITGLPSDKSDNGESEQNTMGKASAANTQKASLTESDDKKVNDVIIDTTKAANLAPSGGESKPSQPAGGQGDKKDGKSGDKKDSKDPSIKEIKVKGKDAVLVKSEGGNSPSVVVIADQSLMKNKEELKKLVGQVGGSSGSDKSGGSSGSDKSSGQKGSPLVNTPDSGNTREGMAVKNINVGSSGKIQQNMKSTPATLVINNKSEAVMMKVKTFTVIEPINKNNVSKKTPAKDEGVKSASKIPNEKDKEGNKKKDDKSKPAQSAGSKNIDKKKTEGESKNAGQKSIIKYETDDKNKNKKEDKESVWSNIFNMNNAENNKSSKRLNNGQKSVQADDKDKTKTNEKKGQKQTPDSKKVVESVVFIGNDKATKTISKNDFSKKNKETSMDDLLYVLKNMPGKVNINKEGKEVYIEGDFFTPKEKDMARKEFKFSGVLKAKEGGLKQK